MGETAKLGILECWRPAVDGHYRELVFYGGSGSGKTWFQIQHCIIRGLQEEDGFSLFLMEDMTSVKSDCFEPMLTMLGRMGIRHTMKESPPYEITLSSGHRVIFSSTSRSSGERSKERLKKFTDAHRVYVNEVTAIGEDDYDILTNRMGRSYKDAQIISSFNPIDKNHWAVRRWVYPYKNGTLPESTLVIHTTYKDNHMLTPEWVASEKAKGERNPNYQRVYLEGEPGVLEGLVYTEGLHWMIDDDFPEQLLSVTPLAVGVDWGAHITAAVGVWDHEGKRYAAELLYESGLDQRKINERLNAIWDARGWSKVKDNLMRCDSAEPDRKFSLAQSGFMRPSERLDIKQIPHVCVDAYKAVLYGIEQVMERTIHIHPSSMNLKDELRNYMWDPKRDERDIMREPLKGFDHACDALRYAIAHEPQIDKMQSDPVFLGAIDGNAKSHLGTEQKPLKSKAVSALTGNTARSDGRSRW